MTENKKRKVTTKVGKGKKNKKGKVIDKTFALPKDFSLVETTTKKVALSNKWSIAEIVVKATRVLPRPDDSEKFRDPKLPSLESHINPAVEHITVKLNGNIKTRNAQLKALRLAMDEERLNKTWVERIKFAHPDIGEALFKINKKAKNGKPSTTTKGPIMALLPLISLSGKKRESFAWTTQEELLDGLPIIPCSIEAVTGAAKISHVLVCKP